MQKPLTPRQQLEYEKLDLAVSAPRAPCIKQNWCLERLRPEYAVAERQRDEIVARMQRITGVLDGVEVTTTSRQSGRQAGSQIKS